MERKDFLRQGGPCFYFDTELFAPTTDSFALGWFAAPKLSVVGAKSSVSK